MSEREQKLQERANENRTVRKIVAIVSLVMVILLVIFLTGGYFYITSALKPVDAKEAEKVFVKIPIGSSVSEIANRLEEQGVIKSALVFRYYVKYKNESGFQAGDYELTTAMTVPEIISKLKEGKVLKEAELKITIPEGYRLTEIAEKIAESTTYNVEEVLDKLQDEAFIDSLIATYPILDEKAVKQKGIKYALEGYLYPATYEYSDKNPSLETIIGSMVAEMQNIIQKYEKEVNTSPYSVHEILTLASLIEEETNKSEDRFKVAGVFYNRLQRNMRLDSDPSVKYALDKTDIQVTYADTDVDSPYNTYRVKGIPIGPIASPREESIKAALLPEKVDELYFFARPNGEVIYSTTLDKHNQVVAKYRHEWNELIQQQNNE